MKKLLLIFYLCCFYFSVASDITAFEVTYVASEGVYINAGTNDGIILGDSLRIYRSDSLQAILTVTNTASLSSACRIIELFGSVHAGDRVDFISSGKPPENLKVEETNKKGQASSSLLVSDNIDGYISIQNYYQHDMTGSSLSYAQPSLVSKIRIEHLSSRDWTFSIRHRSRFIHRARTIGVTFDKDNWYHRVYELSLTNNKESVWQWRFGRQSVGVVRGIGFIDGLTIQRQITNQFNFGVTGGFEPNRETTDISFDHPKAGIFFTWKNISSNDHKMNISFGLAGNYYKSNINREFLTLGSSYYYKQILSLFASSEIDINRSWRKNKEGSSLSLTNIYLNLRYTPFDPVTFYSSYDRRENHLSFEMKNIPDSLFNDDLYQSWRLGSTIKLSKQIRLNGYGGIRFRESSFANNIFASGSLSVNRFPKRGHAVSMRFSYAQTEFTTGYRPSFSYRFPVSSTIRITMAGTAYHYRGSSFSRTQYYLDLQGHYYTTASYFFSGSYRQNFDSNNKSGQLFLELGRYL